MKMATIGHIPAVTNYPLDFSNHVPEVLDLSRTKRSQESPYYRRAISPDSTKVMVSSPHHGEYTQHPRLSPLPSSDSPPQKSQLHISYRDQFYSNESLNHSYIPQNRSPSLYSNDEKDPQSPHNTSGQLSPSFPNSYTAPEQISPFLINAAFQQQLMLQTKKTLKSDPDNISETGSDGSIPTTFPIYQMTNTGRDGKITRPFKAYPKDPMSLANGLSPVDALLDTHSAEKYSEFRRKMLDQICAANGGSATVTNPKMRRTITSSNNNCPKSDDLGIDSKDDTYTERRMKNNAAAKKSRDRRRIKEDEIAIRAAFLEKENLELKLELASIKRHHSLCSLSFVRPSSS